MESMVYRRGIVKNDDDEGGYNKYTIDRLVKRVWFETKRRNFYLYIFFIMLVILFFFGVFICKFI